MFFKDLIKKVFIGIILGFSIIIPGLSGSAIAMSFGLYDEIIDSLSNIMTKFKKSVLFLFPLVFGGIIGILIGAFVIKILFEYYPFYIICFFCGLMIGTFPLIVKQIEFKKSNIFNNLLLISGFVIPLLLAILSLLINKNNLITYNTIDYLIYIIIGFCLAITQLVPGLSATVFLIVIGYYKNLIQLISFDQLLNYKNILVIICFIVGGVLGIILLSSFINNILNKRRNEFMHLICGLLISSILCVFLEEDCIEIYKSFSRSNIIFNILIGLIFIVCGMIITTIIFTNKGEKNEK